MSKKLLLSFSVYFHVLEHPLSKLLNQMMKVICFYLYYLLPVLKFQNRLLRLSSLQMLENILANNRSVRRTIFPERSIRSRSYIYDLTFLIHSTFKWFFIIKISSHLVNTFKSAILSDSFE